MTLPCPIRSPPVREVPARRQPDRGHISDALGGDGQVLNIPFS